MKGTDLKCRNTYAKFWTKRQHKLMYELMHLKNFSLYYLDNKPKFLIK